jgi:excisionase family DNA binding protein
MPQFDDLSDPCSVPEAAAAVGISESTFYRYLRCGEGPEHYRISGLIRIDKSALRSWLEARRHDAGTPVDDHEGAA